MPDLSRILVGLCLDDTDDATLASCSAVAARLGANHVTLLHAVQRTRAMEDAEVDALFTERQVLAEQRAKTAQAVLGASVVLEERVSVGRPAKTMLRAAHDERFGLIVMGRSTYGSGSRLGTDAGAVVRKAPCSVLTVPHDWERGIDTVLVPVDFSDRCADAVQVALRLLRGSERPRLRITHIYEVHSAYGRTGKSPIEADAHYRALAQERWTTFAQRFDFAGLEVEVRLVGSSSSHIANNHHAREMIGLIEACDPDMVVLSSQGRSDVAGLLLGSMAARLVADTARPLLILRQSGDHVGLVQALLRI